MPNYGILRVEKIKMSDGGGIRGRALHNFRENKNVAEIFDPEKTAQNEYIGSQNYEELKNKLEKKWAELSGKPRSDAVGVLEFMITTTAGSISKDKEKDFFFDVYNQVNQYYGHESFLGMAIHRDETTPHCHIFVVPIEQKIERKKHLTQHEKELIEKNKKNILTDEKEKKEFEKLFTKKTSLNAKKIMGGKDKLRKLQDEFFENVFQKYDLARGEQTPEHAPKKNTRSNLQLQKQRYDAKEEQQMIKEAEQKVIALSQKEIKENLKAQEEKLKEEKIKIEKKSTLAKQNLEEIAMRLVNKENDLEKMQQKINKQKEEIQTEKDLIEQTQKDLTKKIEQVYQQEVENNKIYNEYIDEINKYNDSFTKKSLKIEEWENASTMISAVEPFLKKEFSDYSKNRNMQNSLSEFYKKIKKGVEGFIAKTKKLYDGLINDFKKKFFGYDYEDKNGRLIHSFGTQELSNMFLEGNKETFINIAKDMEKYNAKTFSDLCQKNQNTLPKHFEYAREIERKLERNQEISW